MMHHRSKLHEIHLNKNKICIEHTLKTLKSTNNIQNNNYIPTVILINCYNKFISNILPTYMCKTVANSQCLKRKKN